MNVFILNFNEPRSNCNYDGFAAILSTSNQVNSWSVPFRGMFVIKTDLDTIGLQKFVSNYTGPSAEMFLAKLDPLEAAGTMQSQWWDWFNTDMFSEEFLEKLRKRKEARELEKKSPTLPNA